MLAKIEWLRWQQLTQQSRFWPKSDDAPLLMHTKTRIVWLAKTIDIDCFASRQLECFSNWKMFSFFGHPKSGVLKTKFSFIYIREKEMITHNVYTWKYDWFFMVESIKSRREEGEENVCVFVWKSYWIGPLAKEEKKEKLRLYMICSAYNVSAYRFIIVMWP